MKTNAVARKMQMLAFEVRNGDLFTAVAVANDVQESALVSVIKCGE